MTTHDLLQAADGIHGIVTGSNSSNANLGPYASAAARLTAGALLAALNKGSVCQQTDTNQYWMFLGSGAWLRVAGPRSVYSDTTAARTFALTDADALGLFSNTAGAVCTIPLNATVAFPIGAEVEVCQSAAGQVSFSPFSGSVILQAPLGYLGTKSQYSKAKAVKIGTDTWLISGDLAALGGGAFSGDFAGIFNAGTGLTVLHALYGWTGLTKTGSIVNAWANQSGANSNVAEGSSGVGIGSATTGLNGHAGVAANGTTQYGVFTQASITPGTTNVHYYAVYRSLVLPSANAFLIGNAFDMCSFQTGGVTTHNMLTGGGSNVGVTVTTNTWARLRQSFTGSTSANTDEAKWGSGAAAFGNAGNGANVTSRGLFASNAGAGPGNHELAMMLTVSGPKAAFLTQAALADAQLDPWFGTGAVQH